MSVAIDIVPSSDSLDMFGDADTSSAYSLSGHVTIAVTSPFTLYGRRRTARILLHSVTLTFEGQTEVLTPQTGYAAARLCTVTREIAPHEPVEMNNEGHEDSDKPCDWNVVFDMPIPGWLPPSTTYGVEDAGVRYTLFAEAKFTFVDDSSSSSFSFATLCAPFRSRMKTVDTRKHIQLRRLIAPYEDANTEGDMVLQPRISYLINAQASSVSKFPEDVLKKLQVLATVPEHINIEQHAFPLIIRMRTKNLEADKCKRIQVTSVSAKVIQKEKYRTRPSEDYYRRYPIPAALEQPPNVPLKYPHPLGPVYDSGLGAYVGWVDNASREFSLLPLGEPGFHSLGDNNYPFANDADAPPEEPSWYTLESSIPFVHQAPDDKATIWGGSPIIRPSVVSPLVSIIHETAVEVTCAYTLPDTEEVVTECLAFTLPLRILTFAPDPRIERCITPPPVHSVHTQSGSPVPSLSPSKPYTSSLPAYSQLFDRNGDRKIDYSVPLPLYTPQASPEASPKASFRPLTLDLSHVGFGYDEDDAQEMHELDPLLASH
ncbi:hypothetical protein H0H87_005137 [Tephrocybe sp. NHM501043]|nr:hypothetical protein H0H87_005137 [Tephrocybe sp. NHM501043]